MACILADEFVSTAWFARRNVIAELYSAVTAVVGLISILSVFVKTCKTYDRGIQFIYFCHNDARTTGHRTVYVVVAGRFECSTLSARVT